MSISTSHMWSHAEIFQPVRTLVARIPYVRRPILCPECCSFWIGLAVSVLFNPLESVLPVVVSNAMCGLVAHLFASALYKHEVLS